MRDNVYEVLMYIFDHYMEEESDINLERHELMEDLEDEGFRRGEVKDAFSWLESLTEESFLENAHLKNKGSIRVYNTQECAKFSPEARGFLMHLDHSKIIDIVMRELIIDRALALGIEKIDLEEIKWVTLMVVFNQTDAEEFQLDRVEEKVFDEHMEPLH